VDIVTLLEMNDRKHGIVTPIELKLHQRRHSIVYSKRANTSHGHAGSELTPWIARDTKGRDRRALSSIEMLLLARSRLTRPGKLANPVIRRTNHAWEHQILRSINPLRKECLFASGVQNEEVSTQE
jgi:hypothetical protein